MCSTTQLLVFARGAVKELEVDACWDQLEEREACQAFEVNAKGDCNYFIVHQEVKNVTLWEMLISPKMFQMFLIYS